MKLKDLIPSVISKFEDIQLVSAKTGKCLTDVTYYEGGSAYNTEEIDAHMENEVFGISSGMSDNRNPFIRIMIVDV